MPQMDARRQRKPAGQMQVRRGLIACAVAFMVALKCRMATALPNARDLS
jgi:hypothetical protein